MEEIQDDCSHALFKAIMAAKPSKRKGPPTWGDLEKDMTDWAKACGIQSSNGIYPSTSDIPCLTYAFIMSAVKYRICNPNVDSVDRVFTAEEVAQIHSTMTMIINRLNAFARQSESSGTTPGKKLASIVQANATPF